MNLVWRSEPPDCAGWWWMKGPVGIEMPVLIQCYYGNTLVIARADGQSPVFVDQLRVKGWFWAGPIPKPVYRSQGEV